MDQAKPAGPACGAPTAHFPFAIRDEQGEVAVAGFTLPDRQSFRIELARPLAGKATVTGAPGSCPPHVVPRDIHGYRAMLAFTREIERMKGNEED